MAKQSARRTTPKQIAFIKNRLVGMTPHEAALKAGYTKQAAMNAERAIMNATGTRQALEDALREAGVDEKELAKLIKEGLGSTKPVIHEGAIVGEYADYLTRKNYIDTILDITGGRAPKNVDVTSQGEKIPSVVMLPAELDHSEEDAEDARNSDSNAGESANEG